jgi:hypothetical protein
METQLMSNFNLVIKNYNDPTYEHVVATRPTAAGLERIEDGVNINLNHDEFYTEIVEVDE